jgi:hypothetical protein
MSTSNAFASKPSAHFLAFCAIATGSAASRCGAGQGAPVEDRRSRSTGRDLWRWPCRPDRAHHAVAQRHSQPRGREALQRQRQKGLVIDGKPFELAPGMAVVAEIKTGSRRVLDYLLSPLHRYGHDVLRER